MAIFPENYDSGTSITGTAEDEVIINYASDVTITANAGNDSITNSTSEPPVPIFNVRIDAGDGNDYVNNYIAHNGSINAGTGNDTVVNHSRSNANVTILGGEGDDIVTNDAWLVTISGGAGDDTILNSDYSYENGLVNESNMQCSISGGDGDDVIVNSGDGLTINGGAGGDQISLVSSSSNLVQYTEGDGHDTVWGYSNTNSLQINSSVGWSSVVSGNNVVITVSDGSITLVDAATSSGVNINGITYAIDTTASIAPDPTPTPESITPDPTPTPESITPDPTPTPESITPDPTPTPETLPPAVGGTAYDIVFIVDVSGSMGNYISRVNEIAQTFAAKLAERGITDYRLGVIEYETESVIYPLDVYGSLFTADVNAFTTAMAVASNGTRGDTENGLTALTDAVNNYAGQFRPEANKEFILLTDEDYDDGATFSVSGIEQLLTTNGIQLDVIGKVDGSCDSAWTPVARSTGGNFYDINGDYSETFNEIVLNLDCVNVNLANVPDGQTGWFLLVPGNHVTDLKSVDAVFVAASDPNLEAYTQTFEVVGMVSADKVYDASSSRYRQNVTTPDLWNVTGTSHADILNVAGTGFGVVIASGDGHDVIKLGEFATGVILTDHSLDKDGLTFTKRQPLGTFTESVETNPVTLMNQVTLASPTMAIYLQNFSSPLLEEYTSTHEKFLAYDVTNGNRSDTVYDLLFGEDYVGNGDGRIVFAQWGYGFTPPDDNPLITGIVPPMTGSFDLAEDFGSPSLDEISPENFAVTANEVSALNSATLDVTAMILSADSPNPAEISQSLQTKCPR